MSLGDRISTLRTRNHMSQGDLAEVLDVSRQSISKWETNGSVPELDKLVRLSEVFGVSLDGLVKGGTERHPPEAVQESSLPPGTGVKSRFGVREIIGFVLLGFGFPVALWLLILGGGVFSIFFAGPFLCCEVICLTARRRAGVWCAWSVCLCADLYLRYATGLTWRMVFHTTGLQRAWNYVRLAIGWVQFLVPVILFICTLYSFRSVELTFGRKGRFALLGGAGGNPDFAEACLLAFITVRRGTAERWIHTAF